jgi:hypothetical protein
MGSGVYLEVSGDVRGADLTLVTEFLRAVVAYLTSDEDLPRHECHGPPAPRRG